MDAYSRAFASLLASALLDASPDVLAAACEACVALAQMSSNRLGAALALGLARAASPLAVHSRAAVRLSVLDALDALVRCGGQDVILQLSAHREPGCVPLAALYGASCTQVNALAALSADRSHAVRARFLRLAACWALRHEEHAPRLLPYVLLAAREEACDSVRAAAQEALDELARAAEAQCDANERAAFAEREPLARPWPMPLLGARLVVQHNLAAMLPACLLELRAWASDVRPRATALLCEIIRHADDSLGARHAEEILSALCACAADSDAAVAGPAMECVRMLAHILPKERRESLCELMLLDQKHNAMRMLDARALGGVESVTQALRHGAEVAS